MSNVDVKLNTEGVKELLQSSDVSKFLDTKASEIIDRCSGNYKKSSRVGKYRARLSISVADKDTFYRNLHNNELLKALR